MSLYDLFLGSLELIKSNSLEYNLGKIITSYIPVYEQIKAGYYDGSKIDVNEAMYHAAKGGHKELVEKFISLGANEWNWGMRGAAEGGHEDLVEKFISLGANEWSYGMYGAAYSGHKDLVDYFISLGANDWYLGMEYAAQGGHKELVEFFKQKIQAANQTNI